MDRKRNETNSSNFCNTTIVIHVNLALKRIWISLLKKGIPFFSVLSRCILYIRCAMPRHAKCQRCWYPLIGWMQRKMPKISYTSFSCTIVHPLKQPGENQPFFHFNRFIFASYFLFSRNKQFWTFTQHKIRNLVFILSHYSYAELAAFSICANDVFHISVYLAKIYLECVQRREMDSQKLIQKLITTQLDAIKKFVSAIPSRRLVNSICMHIVKDIQSGGGTKGPNNKSKQKFRGRWKEKLPKKGRED